MSKSVITIAASAKVNLSLAVHFPPTGGYHKVDSVYQEVDLCDYVRVSIIPLSDDSLLTTSMGTRVELDCAIEGLAPGDNLVFRALDAVEKACGIPAADGLSVHIEVEKHIPAGGGLGGGSSDAAAVLKAYAQLVGLDPLDSRIIEVSRTLGADVAFFMYGGCALMRGRGDVLDRKLPHLDLPIVLMGDEKGMSTAAIYRAFDEAPVPVPDADALACALEQGSSVMSRNLAALCANNLGPVACAQSPRLQARLDAACAHPSVLNALVSGSGSTSFAICSDIASARQFAHDISPLCDWVHVSSLFA